jgi:hypothetical protein
VTEKGSVQIEIGSGIEIDLYPRRCTKEDKVEVWMPSQRQKSRWPGGAPLTARSGTDVAAVIPVLFFAISGVLLPRAMVCQVPLGTRNSNREWIMNEGPLPDQVLFPGRAR